MSMLLKYLIKRRSVSDKALGSLSKDVFERRMSSGSVFFAFFVSDFARIFGQIVSIRVNVPSNTNLTASRHIRREKASFLVDVRNAFLQTPCFAWSWLAAQNLFAFVWNFHFRFHDATFSSSWSTVSDTLWLWCPCVVTREKAWFRQFDLRFTTSKTLLKIRSPQNADYFVVSSQDVVEFEWDHSI